ncbi:MAG: sugar transferase [Thermoguttaceae bacterium]|nr:sugar transferase [Thermoguttaceae bacterium]
MMVYRTFGKRLCDITVSLFLLVLLSVPLLFLALAVRLFLGSPVFFRQERPGRGGQIFRLIKFRTMTDQRDREGNLLPDAERLTRFGNFLRRTSLDELPELLNVLKGEMSLVGPRPLLVKYLPLYSPEQARRHLVRPGITGWAQVHGRNAITWEEKFRFDVWYVEHVSFWLDLRIIAMTLVQACRREGISAAGCATMPEFKGSEETSGSSEH